MNNVYFKSFREYIKTYKQLFKTNKVKFTFSENEPPIDIDADLIEKLSDRDLYDLFSELYNVKKINELEDIVNYIVRINYPNITSKVYQEMKKIENLPFVERVVKWAGAVFERFPLISDIYAPLAHAFKIDTNVDDIYMLHRELKVGNNIQLTAMDWFWDISNYAYGVLDSLVTVSAVGKLLKGTKLATTLLGFSGVFAGKQAVRSLVHPYEPPLFSREGVLKTATAGAEGLIYPVQLQFAHLAGSAVGTTFALGATRNKLLSIVPQKIKYSLGYVPVSFSANYSFETIRHAIYGKIYGIPESVKQYYDDYSLIFNIISAGLDVIFTIPDALASYKYTFVEHIPRLKEKLEQGKLEIQPIAEKVEIEREYDINTYFNRIKNVLDNYSFENYRAVDFLRDIFNDEPATWITFKFFQTKSPANYDFFEISKKINYSLKNFATLANLKNALIFLEMSPNIKTQENQLRKINQLIESINKAIESELKYLTEAVPGIEVSFRTKEKLGRGKETIYIPEDFKRPIVNLGIKLNNREVASFNININKHWGKIFSLTDIKWDDIENVSPDELLLVSMVNSFFSSNVSLLKRELFSTKYKISEFASDLKEKFKNSPDIENLDIKHNARKINIVLKNKIVFSVPEIEITYKVKGQERKIDLASSLLKDEEFSRDIVGYSYAESRSLQDYLEKRGIKSTIVKSTKEGFILPETVKFINLVNTNAKEDILFFKAKRENLNDILEALAEFHRNELKNDNLVNDTSSYIHEMATQLFEFQDGSIAGISATNYTLGSVYSILAMPESARNVNDLKKIYYIHNHPLFDVGAFSASDILGIRDVVNFYRQSWLANVSPYDKKTREKINSIDFLIGVFTNTQNYAEINTKIGEIDDGFKFIEDKIKSIQPLSNLVNEISERIINERAIYREHINEIVEKYKSDLAIAINEIARESYETGNNFIKSVLISTNNDFLLKFLSEEIVKWVGDRIFEIKREFFEEYDRPFFESSLRLRMRDILNEKEIISNTLHLQSLPYYILGFRYKGIVMLPFIVQAKDAFEKFVSKLFDGIIQDIQKANVLKPLIGSQAEGLLNFYNILQSLDESTRRRYLESSKNALLAFLKSAPNVYDTNLTIPKQNIYSLYFNAYYENILGSSYNAFFNVIRGIRNVLGAKRDYKRYDPAYYIASQKLRENLLPPLDLESVKFLEDLLAQFLNKKFDKGSFLHLFNSAMMKLLNKLKGGENYVVGENLYNLTIEIADFIYKNIENISIRNKAHLALISHVFNIDYKNYDVLNETYQKILNISGIASNLTNEDKVKLVTDFLSFRGSHHLEILSQILYSYGGYKDYARMKPVDILNEIKSVIKKERVDIENFNQFLEKSSAERGLRENFNSFLLYIREQGQKGVSVDEIKANLIKKIENYIDINRKKIDKINKRIGEIRKAVDSLEPGLNNLKREIDDMIKTITKIGDDEILMSLVKLDYIPEELEHWPEFKKKYPIFKRRIQKLAQLIEQYDALFKEYKEKKQKMIGYSKSINELTRSITQLEGLIDFLSKTTAKDAIVLYKNISQKISRQGEFIWGDLYFPTYTEWLRMKFVDLIKDIIKAQSYSDVEAIINEYNLQKINDIELTFSDKLNMIKRVYDSMLNVINSYNVKPEDTVPFGLKNMFKNIEQYKRVKDLIERVEDEKYDVENYLKSIYNQHVGTEIEELAKILEDSFGNYKRQGMNDAQAFAMLKASYENYLYQYIGEEKRKVRRYDVGIELEIKRFIENSKNFEEFINKLRNYADNLRKDIQRGVEEVYLKRLQDLLTDDEFKKFEFVEKMYKFLDEKIDKFHWEKIEGEEISDELLKEYENLFKDFKKFDRKTYQEEATIIEPVFAEYELTDILNIRKSLTGKIENSLEGLKLGYVNTINALGELGALKIYSYPIAFLNSVRKRLKRYLAIRDEAERRKMEETLINQLAMIYNDLKDDYKLITSILFGASLEFDPFPKKIDSNLDVKLRAKPFTIFSKKGGDTYLYADIIYRETGKPGYIPSFERETTFTNEDILRNIDKLLDLFVANDLDKVYDVLVIQRGKDVPEIEFERVKKSIDLLGKNEKEFQEIILSKIVKIRDEILNENKLDFKATDYKRLDLDDRIKIVDTYIRSIRDAENLDAVVNNIVKDLKDMGVAMEEKDISFIKSNSKNYDVLYDFFSDKIGSGKVLISFSYREAKQIADSLRLGNVLIDRDRLYEFVEDLKYYVAEIITRLGLAKEYRLKDTSKIIYHFTNPKVLGRASRILDFIYGFTNYISRSDISSFVEKVKEGEVELKKKVATIYYLDPQIISAIMGGLGDKTFIRVPANPELKKIFRNVSGLTFEKETQEQMVDVNYDFIPSPGELVDPVELSHKAQTFAGKIGDMIYNFSKNNRLTRDILALFEGYGIFMPNYRELEKIINVASSKTQMEIENIVNNYKKLKALIKKGDITDDILFYYATHTAEDFANKIDFDKISEFDRIKLEELYRIEATNPNLHPAVFLKKKLMEIGLELYRRNLIDEPTFKTMFGRYLHRTYYSFTTGAALEPEKFIVHLSNTKVDFSMVMKRAKNVLPELKIEEIKDPAFLMAISAVSETLMLGKYDAIRMIAKSNYLKNWVAPSGLFKLGNKVFTYAQAKEFIKNELSLVKALKAQLRDAIKSKVLELQQTGLSKRAIKELINSEYGNEKSKIDAMEADLLKIKILIPRYERLIKLFERYSKQKKEDLQIFLRGLEIIYKPTPSELKKKGKIEQIQRWLNEEKEGLTRFFTENWGSLRKIPGSAETIGKDRRIRTYGELADLIVHRGLWEDISSYYDIQNPNFRLDFVEGLKGFVGSLYKTFKLSKVAFNIATSYINNFISNVFQMSLWTGAGYHEVFNYLGKAISHIISNSPIYNAALKAGLEISGFSKGEMYEMKKALEMLIFEKKAFPTSIGEYIVKKLKHFANYSGFAGLGEKIADLYSKIDSLFRLAYVLYYAENDVYKIYDENSRINMDELAKAIADAYTGTINYAHTSHYIKEARRPENWYSIFFSPFITYKAKIMGVFARSLFRRPFTTIATLMFPVALKLFMWYLIPEEDRENLAKLTIESYKSLGIIYTPIKTPEGKYIFINYNFHPVIDHLSASQALINGNFEEIVNFTGFGISGSAQLANILISGKDPFTGVRVYSEYDPALTKLFNTLLYTTFNFLPNSVLVGLKYMGLDVKQVRDNPHLYMKIFGLNTYSRSLTDMYIIKNAYLKMLESEIAMDMARLKRQLYYGQIDFNEYQERYIELLERKMEIKARHYKEMGDLGMSPLKSLFFTPGEVDFEIDEEGIKIE